MVAHEERLWTKRDVAEYLGVTLRTVERLGVPRVAIVGRGGARPIVRYDPKEVKAWIAKRKSRTLLSVTA